MVPSSLSTYTHPFISLFKSPNFSVDYAFFSGTSLLIVDGFMTYENMFDANHDTLDWALRKNGFENLLIIVREIGWPTDGAMNANLQFTRFNQGFMNHISIGQETPMRLELIDACLFSSIDENKKSIQPGNFERHRGIYTFDSLTKYQLNLKITNGGIVPAKNVRYLEKKWRLFNPSTSLEDDNLASSISYTCRNADCTSLGYKTPCGDLNRRGNISYAFNSYYQRMIKMM